MLDGRRANRHAAPQGALENPIGFLPREAQAARDGGGGGLLEPRDRQPLEEDRENRECDVAQGTATVFTPCVAHWMRGMRACRAGLVLAGVEVAPTPLHVIIQRRGRAAIRTEERGPGALLQPDVHRLGRIVELHAHHVPRRRDP